MLRTNTYPRAARERLLVVEDDDLVRRSIARVLIQEGYDVMAVASAEEALCQVQRWRFDLCLVDINLPQMDGLEFLEQCQSQLSETGTVVLTG